MNKRVKRFFAIICDNKIVCLNTNIKHLHRGFVAIEPGAISYITLFRKFNPDKETRVSEFTLTLSGTEYHFMEFIQPQ